MNTSAEKRAVSNDKVLKQGNLEELYLPAAAFALSTRLEWVGFTSSAPTRRRAKVTLIILVQCKTVNRTG